MPRLQSKAAPLEELLHEKMVESVQSRFKQASGDPQRQLSQQSRDCVRRIKANGYVTFGDLATLSKEMPEIKLLHITGTAMLDGRPQMVVFNAEPHSRRWTWPAPPILQARCPLSSSSLRNRDALPRLTQS